MKTPLIRSGLVLGLAFLISTPTLADRYTYGKHYSKYDSSYRRSPSAPHAGKVDTDGILSRGEIKNPLINYNRMERRAAYYGDWRYNNPYNRAAAADARYWSEKARQERAWKERHTRSRYNDRFWSWW